MLRSALALGVVVLVAGPTAAELTLVVDAPSAPMKPLMPATVSVHVTVDCQAVLARSLGGDVQMSLALDASATYAIVTGSQGTMSVDPTTCQGGSANTTVDRDYLVTMLREAPGLRPVQIKVTASLPGHPTDDLTGGPRIDEENFAVTPDAELFSEVQAPVLMKHCPCPVTFDVDVTNFGNVRTRYTFELASAPPVGLPASAVVMPEPVELDPSTAGSTSTGTAKVVFQAPADGWSGEAMFLVTVNSAAVDDPAAIGEPRTVSLMVRNEAPLDKGLPGPDPLVLVLLLAFIASLLSRRRA